MIGLNKSMSGTGLIVLLFLAGFLCLSALGYGPIQPVLASTGNAQQNAVVVDNNNRGNDNQNLAQVQNRPPEGGSPGQGRDMAHPPSGGGGPRGGGGPNSGSNYALPLLIYAVAFLIVFITAYFLYRFNKFRVNPGYGKIIILTLLGIALILRIAIANSVGGHMDLNIFGNWASTAAKNLFQVYSGTGHGSSDYPPLYIYILFLIGKLIAIPSFSTYSTLLLKLPSILADIGTAYLIYKLARKYVSLEISILLSAFYAFNPAVFINSVFYGQVDSLLTYLVVLALYMLLEEKIALSACLFILAILLKPQGIILCPVLFFELARRKDLKSFIKAGFSAVCTLVIVVLPFALKYGILWIFKLYANTISEYPSASMNAFNFYSLIGANNARDSVKLFFLSYHNWGLIFIVIITAISWFIYIKGNSRLFAPASALLLITGVFIFATSMHERYLFPAAAMAILAFIGLRDKRLLLLIIGFSATSYINTQAVLYGTLTGSNVLPFNETLIAVSAVNILLFIYLIKISFDIVVRKRIYY